MRSRPLSDGCGFEIKERLYKSMSDTAERVKKIVVEHLNVDADKVTDNASFIEDLGADSLDTVELVMAFEEEFGIEIPDDAAESIVTVGDAVKYIDKAQRPDLAVHPCAGSSSQDLAWSRRWPAAWRRRWARLLAGKSGASADHQIQDRRPADQDRLPGAARRRRRRHASIPTSGSIPRNSGAWMISSSIGLAAAKQAVTDSGWEPKTEEERAAHRRPDRLGHRRAGRHRGSRDPGA